MAAILQLRRGTTALKPTLSAGEMYVNTTSQSLQVGIDGSTEITLAKLNSVNSGSFNVSGDITLGGTITIGDTTSDNIVFNADLSSSLIPNNDNSFDLGSTSSKYRNVYATSISGAIASTNGVVSGSSQVIGILSSLNSFSASNGNTSLNSYTSSQDTKNTTLATYTASLDTKNTTLATYTGSIDTKNTTLATTTGSLLSSQTNLNSYTSSLKAALTASGADVIINGNLTIAGTTTTVNTQTLNVADNIIELNFGGTAVRSGIYTKDITGISSLSGSLLWDATNDYWIAGISGSESKVLRAGSDSVVSGSSQILGGSGVISGSTQLPSGIVSSSAQTITNLPTGVVSSSVQVLGSTGIFSSSAQLPTGTISGSSQLTASFDTRYTLSGSVVVATTPAGTISGSSQLTASFDTRYLITGSVTSSITQLNSFTSSLNIWTSSVATTGSNNFIGNQTITGSLTITGSAKGNIVPITIASSTASLDMNVGSYFTLTLANTVTTHIRATNITPGTTATLLITTGTNSSASLAPTLLQPSGSLYTASFSSGKKDVLSLVSFDTTNMYVVSTKTMQ